MSPVQLYVCLGSGEPPCPWVPAAGQDGYRGDPPHQLKAVSLLSDSLVPFALSPHIQYPAWEWRRGHLDKVGLLQRTWNHKVLLS